MKYALKYLLIGLVLGSLFFPEKIYSNDFIKYTSKNGLSIDIIDCIAQDKEGFLYFGTPNGLNIFNGSTFKVFNSKNTLNFTDQVKRILPLTNQIILIGSLDRGVFIYNKLYESIIPLKIVKKNKNTFLQIKALHIDNQNNVWIGTLNNGLLKIPLEQIINYKQKNKIQFESIKYNFNKSVTSILYTPQNLWVGTLKNGLYKLDLTKNDNHFEKFETSFNDVWDIKLFNNKLYIGQDGGLEIINLKNDKRRVLITHQQDKTNVTNVITSITKDNSGRIWLTTLNDGVYNISSETDQVIDHFINVPSDSRTININKVLCSHFDKNGNLWLGTWYGGINMIRLDSYKFRNYKFKDRSNDLSKNITWKIIPFFNNNYLLGMNGNGICILDPTKSYFKKSAFLKDLEFVSAFYLDKKAGYLWVGTWDSGLIKYNIRTGQRKNIQINKANNVRIHDITMDRHGVLWIGTDSKGLYSINSLADDDIPKQHFVYPNYNAEINNGHLDIRKTLEDIDNTLWIGSLNYGVLKVKTDNKGNIINSNLIQVDKALNKIFYNLRTLFKDESNNIWIGYENGLVKYNIESQEIIEISQFENIKITKIIEFNNKEFWISSYSGLYKFTPSTGEVIHFFQNEIINSIYKDDQTGNLWLASSLGVHSFDPQNLNLNKSYPKIVLSNFKENEKIDASDSEGNILKLNYRKEITRNYVDNSILFKVSTLFFGENKENIISYRLLDYDNEWSEMTGSEVIISYKNLPSGEYRLEVKVKSQFGVINPENKILFITILPPWWASKYAFLVYGLLILSSLFFIKYLISKNHQIKISKINHEKENELNDLKLSFFTNISHDIRTPLTLILSPIENLLANDIKDSWINKQHKIIHKNADLLLKLINQILDFRKLESKKMSLKVSNVNIEMLINNCITQFENITSEKNIKIILINSTSNLDLWVDSNKMEKVFINLISNAVKYGNENKEIIIRIEKIKDNVIIKIVNYGSLIKPKDINNIFNRFYQSNYSKGGSGIGLSIVKSIVNLHKGEISVTSKSIKGTTFTIKLPLGKQHLNENEFLSVSTMKNQNKYIELENDNVNGNYSKTQETILIIEDNDDIRNYLVDTLENEYNTIDVNSGELGIEKAEILMPSLILCDIMMEGIDGLEVCEKLKTNIDTSHIPIILLTAKSTDEDKIRGYKHGADDYITKPFSTVLVKTRISNLLEQRNRLKEKLHLPNIEPRAYSPTSIDEAFMKQAMLIIENNISNNLLSIEDIAKEIGMTQTQFYRKIKNLTGYSASQFIRVVRLKRAAQMLSTKKYKISEVVYEVGFSSPSYFTKCFKELFGKSPTDFML